MQMFCCRGFSDFFEGEPGDISQKSSAKPVCVCRHINVLIDVDINIFKQISIGEMSLTPVAAPAAGEHSVHA